jgi:TRAP-type C4-dicarboxylate transport system permease large subunit
VLNHPLVWSDELASALFLWLAMLGAVVALGRGERNDPASAGADHHRFVPGVVDCRAVYRQAAASGGGALAQDQNVLFAGCGPSGPASAPRAAMLRALLMALPALALPLLIRAAVVQRGRDGVRGQHGGHRLYGGSGPVAASKGQWSRVYPILVDTASLAGAILLIIGMAAAMAWSLTQSGFGATLVEAMRAVPGGRAGFMAVSMATFAVLGSVLEEIPAIVLLGSLLSPAARALGVHDVRYAMIVVLAMGFGLFASPFGVGFYFPCAIGGASLDGAWKRVWPYLGALLAATVLVATIPWLSTGFL